MTYNPALDGLRAVAVILVMLFHAKAPAVAGGFLGVDVFFVLSGYLITTLLLNEFDATGRIKFLKFYIRRLLRLAPALALFLLIYVLIAPKAWPKSTDYLTQALIALTYLSDYGVAFWDIPREISHTWSLSVEEHFYILWPLVMLVASRRYSSRQLVIALTTAYLLATAWRWAWIINGQTWNEIYYRFDTRLSGLILGALLAASLRDTGTAKILERLRPYLLWLPILALFCLQYAWGTSFILMRGFVLAEWATVAVLLNIRNPSGPIHEMLAAQPLVWLGKISYGVYLWHYPIFRFLRHSSTWDTVILIGTPLTILLASVSYYTLEKWARSMRRDN